MNRTKYVVLVGDGMGDYPVEELDGRTPLQAAHTPHMDRVARLGRLGQVRTIPDGMEPGSDVANLNILGYDPAQYHTGRAPLEAASMGIELSPDQVALRCNLVTLRFAGDEVFMKDYSGGHIATETAAPVIRELDRQLGGEGVRFFPGVSYRHLMVWEKGPHPLPNFPPHDLTDQEVGRFLTPDSMPHLHDWIRRSWPVLASLRQETPELRANSIWLWGGGTAPRLPAFEKRFGVRGGVISAVDLIHGIGTYAGLTSIHVPGATGYLDTNYDGKVAAALEGLQDLDLIYLHVEAPDEAGHEGSLELKLRAIEDFDARVVGPLLEGLETFDRYRVLLITDHRTPLVLRTHSEEPIPFVLLDRNDRSERTAGVGFNEADAERSPYHVPQACLLMEQLVVP